MALSLPNGATVELASTYATSIAMSAVSNAAEAVATLANATGLAVGDYLEITSSWGQLDGQVARIKTIATNNVTLEKVDTSDTKRFPAGGGAGSVRKISARTAMSQIDKWEMSGGETQTTTFQPLDTNQEVKLPAQKSAQEVSFAVGDDPSLPQHALLRAQDVSRTPIAVFVTLPSGSVMVFNARVGYTGVPKMNKNSVMVCEGNMYLVAALNRY